MSYQDRLQSNIKRSIAAKETFLGDRTQLENFEKAVSLIVECYRKGGRLYVAGNGGSAADAQHIAAELVVKLGRQRPSIPAESLTTDTSAITAIGNDFGYEEIFSRQLSGKAKKGDVFLGITTSGKSPNMLRAFEACREIGVPSILLGGWTGGPARALADISIIAPGEDTSGVQEVHMVIYHTLCACIEEALFPI